MWLVSLTVLQKVKTFYSYLAICDAVAFLNV